MFNKQYLVDKSRGFSTSCIFSSLTILCIHSITNPLKTHWKCSSVKTVSGFIQWQSYLNQVENKPWCHSLPDDIDEEVCEGHSPDVRVCQYIINKQLQKARLICFRWSVQCPRFWLRLNQTHNYGPLAMLLVHLIALLRLSGQREPYVGFPKQCKCLHWP